MRALLPLALPLTLTLTLTLTLSRCALYFLADALIITSLREGMCEIAFEYIACQQKNHGVLILSEFVGAAQTLGPRPALP